MAHVAETGAHRAENVFRRHSALLRRPLPAVDHTHHSQERNRIEQKNDSWASSSNQKPSERRAHGTRNINGHPRQSNSRRDLPARHYLRKDRLKSRTVHRSTKPEGKSKQEQQPGRDHPGQSEQSQRGRRDKHPALRDEQKPASIDDVSQSPRW